MNMICDAVKKTQTNPKPNTTNPFAVHSRWAWWGWTVCQGRRRECRASLLSLLQQCRILFPGKYFCL